MEVIHLQDDPGEPYGSESVGVLWIVTDYESGSWDGSGTAIGFDGKNLLSWGLGHCSCNGPFDDAPEKIALKDYFGNSVAFWSAYASPKLMEAVDAKLKEINLNRIVPRSDTATCLLAQVRSGQRDLLPILADAIEDDGEDDADLLAWMRATPECVLVEATK